MGRSPSVQSTAATLAQAQAQLKASKSTYWPQLALGGSWTYNGNNANNFGLQNQRQVNLGLNWAIFNRFVRERNIDLQDSNLQVAEANAADAEHQVQSLMLGQFAQVDATRLQMEISQQSLEASREDLRVVAERYRLGRGDDRRPPRVAGEPDAGGAGGGERPVRLPAGAGPDRSHRGEAAVSKNLLDTAERMAQLPADMPRDAVIVTRNLEREYDHGRRDGARAPRRGPHHPAQRVRGHHGPVGLRQVHPDEHDRLPRHAVRRRVLAQRLPGLGAGRRRAGPHPEQGDRVRVPDLQPAARAPRRCTTWSCRWSTPASRRSSGKELASEALRRVRPGRPDAPPPERAVRRPAPARRDRARAGQPAQHPAGRRADRQPRLDHQRGDHGACSRSSTPRARPSSWSPTNTTSPRTPTARSTSRTDASSATS